jgi:hypothetical protein
MHDDFFLLSDLLLFKMQMSKDDFRRSLDIIGTRGCDPGKNTREGVGKPGKICGIRNLGRQSARSNKTALLKIAYLLPAVHADVRTTYSPSLSNWAIQKSMSMRRDSTYID